MTDKRFFKQDSMVMDNDKKLPSTIWSNLQQQEDFCNQLNDMWDTVINLNNALQESLEENIMLKEKYDRETEFLIKENVNLKHELAEYKKNGE